AIQAPVSGAVPMVNEFDQASRYTAKVIPTLTAPSERVGLFMGSSIDPRWFDRKRVDQEIKGVDYRELKYDPDLGVYLREEAAFTGVCTQRYPDGSLESLVHLVQGVAEGVSAAWHTNGQLALYNEMAHDVYDGLQVEWAEDGTKLVEERYS